MTVVSKADAFTQTEECAKTLAELKREIKVLKQNVKRKDIRLTNLKEMLKMLRDEKMVNEDFETFIMNNFEGENILFRYTN